MNKESFPQDNEKYTFDPYRIKSIFRNTKEASIDAINSFFNDIETKRIIYPLLGGVYLEVPEHISKVCKLINITPTFICSCEIYNYESVWADIYVTLLLTDKSIITDNIKGEYYSYSLKELMYNIDISKNKNL